MNYLHSMLRITDVKASLHFYCDLLGLRELQREENENGQFTNIFLVCPEDFSKFGKDASCLELTYNWQVEDYGNARNFGHLAFHVSDIYQICQKLQNGGVRIHRPPRDGMMAFVKSPDEISIEILQRGVALPIVEPWASMPNSGSW